MSGVPAVRPKSLVLAVTNAADGLEAWVIRRAAPETGYAVLLVDLDSGETCSAVLFYPLIRDAIGKAIALSGIYTV